MPTNTPPEPEEAHTGDPGRSPVELEIYLRVGGEWRHMYGSFYSQRLFVNIMPGGDRTAVVATFDARSVEEAVAYLADVTRGEFD